LSKSQVWESIYYIIKTTNNQWWRSAFVRLRCISGGDLSANQEKNCKTSLKSTRKGVHHQHAHAIWKANALGDAPLRDCIRNTQVKKHKDTHIYDRHYTPAADVGLRWRWGGPGDIDLAISDGAWRPCGGCDRWRVDDSNRRHNPEAAMLISFWSHRVNSSLDSKSIAQYIMSLWPI
jgi:hypothetical protein